MWLTAERRFVGHVCLRNLFPPFFFGIQSIHSLPEATASCPSLHCSSKKNPVPCTETEGLVIELWSPRFLTMQWLCSEALSCALWLLQTNDSFVEIELLATVSWTCGCQPFSCRCSQNVTHCRKEICWTCLFKESFPAIPFGNSRHPLPTRSLTFLRRAARSSSSSLWLHHAHPFVAAAEKIRLRQTSRRLGHGVVISRNCWKQGWAASLSAADVGKIWCAAERRFVGHVCLRNPFLPFLFGNSKFTLSTRSRFLKAAQHAPPTLHYDGCIMPVTSLQLQEKPVLCREAEGLVTKLRARRFVTLQWLCSALSCAMRQITESCLWSIQVYWRKRFFSVTKTLHFACIMLAKDPIPLSKIPDLCLMQRNIGLVTELWSPRFVTEYWNVFFAISHIVTSTIAMRF